MKIESLSKTYRVGRLKEGGQLMLYIKIMTILAALLTIFFSYDEYKHGKMKSKNFKIVCVCESIALIGMLYLSFTL